MSNKETFPHEIDGRKVSESAKLKGINEIKGECNESMLASFILGMEELNEAAQLPDDKNNKFGIKYKEEPGLQLLAVQQNGGALKYIENPYERVQLAAVQLDINDIEEPSDNLQLAAVQQNGFAIAYIENPSEEVQLLALQKDLRVFQYIKNPCEEAKRIARSKSRS